MVYRIHFTAQDLTRTHVATAPLPMVELTEAARALQRRSQPARLDAWRREAIPRLSPQTRLALALTPGIGVAPEFFCPLMTGSPDQVLEHVRATPGRRIAAEVSSMAQRWPVPSWTRRLADDAELRDDLLEGWRQLYTQLLEPHWVSITDLHAADRTVRARQMLTGGVEHLLAQANPRWMRWNPPVLEIRTVMKEAVYDLHLEGRGLLLVPSTFLTTSSSVNFEGDSQPVVTYPAGQHHPLMSLTALTPKPTDTKAPTAVTALLGRTRAAVLSTIAEHPGCGTREIARRVGIAPASASEHTTVLREAGLVHTARHRNTALHSPTHLGTTLLNAPPPT
ncbi:winged helix-turn-helix domain-containing protein [Streptomyces sp. NPDC047315]|uniref:winged helix-turn-helix domain-containing protein n=1 Tax=Streptomyces sp. NPDC047315 TaxID=3155142 RepID=UPI003401E822